MLLGKQLHQNTQEMFLPWDGYGCVGTFPPPKHEYYSEFLLLFKNPWKWWPRKLLCPKCLLYDKLWKSVRRISAPVNTNHATGK